MDFEYSASSTSVVAEMASFMDESVYPSEIIYREEMANSGDPHHHPQVLESLKAEARRRGLWNLFLPDANVGGGLSVLDYAPVAELSGRSPEIAPEAINCSAPDTGNMEILHLFGTDDQKERWLTPLLEGTIRSCFSMTEPNVASSDATNIETAIRREGDDLVVSGRKWFSTGASSPRCRFSIVMGVTSPTAEPHRRQSMVIVPMDTPGVVIEKDPKVFGYLDRGGHPQISFDGVKVPASNLLGEPGSGFAIAQARLGPGRIHHCMRALGAAERCLELMIARAKSRVAFGVPLASQGVVQEWIAEARIQIEQARLLVLKAAWMIDNHGAKAARTEIAAIKVIAPRVLTTVADRGIQLFGAAGFTDQFPIASAYAMGRWLQIADGPDEVHKRTVARQELGRLGLGSADFGNEKA